MTATPTGRVEIVDGAPALVIRRTFNSPIEDVWASVTESERLARWIGTWSGDPISGSVQFVMSAEEGAPTEEMVIRECVPPKVLRVTSRTGEHSWSMDLLLSEADGVTTVEFHHPRVTEGDAPQAGPGWEFYLDRWVTAQSGGDPDTIAFEPDYWPGMQEHYRRSWEETAG